MATHKLFWKIQDSEISMKLFSQDIARARGVFGHGKHSGAVDNSFFRYSRPPFARNGVPRNTSISRGVISLDQDAVSIVIGNGAKPKLGSPIIQGVSMFVIYPLWRDSTKDGGMHFYGNSIRPVEVVTCGVETPSRTLCRMPKVFHEPFVVRFPNKSILPLGERYFTAPLAIENKHLFQNRGAILQNLATLARWRRFTLFFSTSRAGIVSKLSDIRVRAYYAARNRMARDIGNKKFACRHIASTNVSTNIHREVICGQ